MLVPQQTGYLLLTKFTVASVGATTGVGATTDMLCNKTKFTVTSVGVTNEILCNDTKITVLSAGVTTDMCNDTMIILTSVGAN